MPSGDGLVQLDNKPTPEPILIKLGEAIWQH